MRPATLVKRHSNTVIFLQKFQKHWIVAVWPLYNWKYTVLSMSHDQKLTLLPGFYPSTFLQPVNGCKNSILNWVLKLNLFKPLQIFFCMFVSKTLDRLFILLHHCFYSGKPQICTKQTGLNIQLHKKISAAALKKSKTNMMVVQMLLF